MSLWAGLGLAFRASPFYLFSQQSLIYVSRGLLRAWTGAVRGASESSLIFRKDWGKETWVRGWWVERPPQGPSCPAPHPSPLGIILDYHLHQEGWGFPASN